MMKRRYLFFAIVLVISLIYAGNKAAVFADTQEEIICNGVYVGDIHIGGMTRTQAMEAINQYTEQVANKKIELVVDNNSEEILLNDLGFAYAEFDFVDRALEVGKTGNLIKRYKELKDIEHQSLVYELELSIDESKIQEVVERLAEENNIDSKNASLSKSDKGFKITDHVVGRKVSVDDSVNKIKVTIMDNLNDEFLSIGLIVMEDIPMYVREDFERVKDVLGTFSTTYTTSSNSRAANLSNGARLINGTVLLPDEVFSTYKLLNPYTVENGYQTAGAYSQGMVIDSIGGGVCQVSTTLYNAVLFSELEVVERSPHSMTVGYVDLSRDAALAGDYKDFKFKNSTETPIYIEATTVGRKITFNIYGEETRSSTRVIKFESETVSTTNPPAEVVKKDSSLPEGTRRVTQAAHYGYKANCYKVVYEDGVEIERKQINSSTYSASPTYVTIGTKKIKTADTDKSDNKGDKKKPTENTNNTNNASKTDKIDKVDKIDKKNQDNEKPDNSQDNVNNNEDNGVDEEELVDVIDDLEDVFSEE